MVSKKLHVVSLGSSFAAGPGLPPFEDPVAARSKSNYPHLLAGKLGATLTDLTVSGATLNNVISEAQNMEGRTYAPQLSMVPTDADIITITGGGNDMNYIGGMIRDALQHNDMDLPAMDLASSATREQVVQRFLQIIDALSKMMPTAQVVLVEYLPLLGAQTHAADDMPLSKDEMNHHAEVAVDLRAAYRETTQARPQVLLVPVSDFGADHCIGSKEPWVNGFNRAIFAAGGAFHPNQAGMNAVAEHIFKQLCKVTDL